MKSRSPPTPSSRVFFGSSMPVAFPPPLRKNRGTWVFSASSAAFLKYASGLRPSTKKPSYRRRTRHRPRELHDEDPLPAFLPHDVRRRLLGQTDVAFQDIFVPVVAASPEASMILKSPRTTISGRGHARLAISLPLLRLNGRPSHDDPQALQVHLTEFHM